MTERVVTPGRIINHNCLTGGCFRWEAAARRPSAIGPDCGRCGFNPAEDRRRQALPLVKGEDGRWGKQVPADLRNFEGCPPWMVDRNCPGIDCGTCWARKGAAED